MQVFNKLKRSLSMASAILIGLSNFTPIIAEAQGAVSDVSTYKVIVENFTSYENQKPLKGATYDFNLVANKKADGSYEELSTPQKIASKTIGSTDKEIFFETSKEGRYQVVQTSRPDGYYLGQGFDQAGKVAEISFPQMENGLESTNKEVRLSPKFTKIVKSVEIQKLGEDNDQLNNTTFTLTPGELNQNHDTEDEAVRTINVINNKLVLENLVEGKYTLQETTAQDGYGLDSRPIDIEVSAPKDATSPDQVTVKVTRNNVEIEGLVINNYKVPTPGANSNGKPFDKVVKGPKDQGFVKKTKVGKGEEVQYKIDIDVPTDIKDYNKFVFYDKLDDALEFNSNTFKELNGVTSTPTPSEKYYSIAEAIKVKDNPDLTLVKFKGLDVPADKADQVKEGGQVEITTTVKDGYKITKILVNGKEMTGNTFTLTEIPTNVEIVTENTISRLRLIQSSSLQSGLSGESTDGTMRVLDSGNSQSPLNYGEAFDVVEVDKSTPNIQVKTLIKHSDTKNFPIVKITNVNGKTIEVEDENGARTFLQIDNAEIFSGKRYGKLETGTSIQFKKADDNEKVAEIISLLEDQTLKGSLVNKPSIFQMVGKLLEIKEVNNQWMIEVNDSETNKNYYIDKADVEALKKYVGTNTTIIFKSVKGQQGYFAYDFRINESQEKPLEQCTDIGNGWTNCDFTYNGNKVTGFSESGLEKVKINKDLIIPNTDPQGNSITNIGRESFGSFPWYTNKKDYNLNSIAISGGITNIEYGAFINNQLTSVTIPEGVIGIGDFAFSYNQITNIKLPNTLKNLSGFSNNKLTSVIMPKSVVNIKYNAFNSNQLTSVTIPEGVTSIGDKAFSNNQLTSITIPEGVTSIGDCAFLENQLTKVNIPNTLTKINDTNDKSEYGTPLNTFAKNPGVDGKVQLFTPDGTNPHKIKDNDYFVVNPQGEVRPANSIPAKLFSFFKPIKANALEVEEGKEPIAVTSGPDSPQETYINSIDISSLGDNPNTFIKNGVLISYDPATKTIVGKIIDPKSFTDKHITVTFSAKVLENKTIYNDVTVIYDNGKGSTGTPNLPQDKQPVVVGEAGKITIKKIDGKTNTLLQGAEFKLMVKENDTWVDFNATTEGNTNATNAQGLLVFKDLPIREYKLVETKAPVIAGKTYNLTKEEIIIDLTKTAEVEKTVANYDSETWIPRTGTMGMLPYILGAVILAGAGICLERKSKR